MANNNTVDITLLLDHVYIDLDEWLDFIKWCNQNGIDHKEYVIRCIQSVLRSRRRPLDV